MVAKRQNGDNTRALIQAERFYHGPDLCLQVFALRLITIELDDAVDCVDVRISNIHSPSYFAKQPAYGHASHSRRYHFQYHFRGKNGTGMGEGKRTGAEVTPFAVWSKRG
jgi:hypothetical protein